MSYIQKIYEKYKTKDFIEVTDDIQKKAIEWATGKIYDGQVNLKKAVLKLSERGFIKFLNEGVILIKSNSVHIYPRFFSYKFTDEGNLHLSVYTADPLIPAEEFFMGLLCKVEMGVNGFFKIVENTYNEALAQRHIEAELRSIGQGVVSFLTPMFDAVREKYPAVVPGSYEWNYQVGQEYYKALIDVQLVSVLAINAYLALLEKEILISKIEQTRVLKASDKGGKRNKRNMNYRYIVSLPFNYQPRKFDLNYVVKEWQVQGHKASRWVRRENAETLAKRCNGVVLWNETKGVYVKMIRPIEPKVAHRRIGNPTEQMGTKLYH